MSDLIERARIFATEAHAAVGQRRKYTNEPYIVHPASVVQILREHGINDEATICAAWLHDVLEDCAIESVEIRVCFGPEIEKLVLDLTHCHWPGHNFDLAGFNREDKKTFDRARFLNADARAQTIKVADIIDNTSTIVRYDPDFAKVYMREIGRLLVILTGANPGLWLKAYDQVINYEKQQLSTWLQEHDKTWRTDT